MVLLGPTPYAPDCPHPLYCAMLQGKMAECMGRQVTGYTNWKATITPQVGGSRTAGAGIGWLGGRVRGSAGGRAGGRLRQLDGRHRAAVGGWVTELQQWQKWHEFGSEWRSRPPHPPLNTHTCAPLQPYLEHFADSKDQLVYLTADSDNELTEVCGGGPCCGGKAP